MVLGYNSNRVSALIQVQPQSQKAKGSPGIRERLDINKDDEFSMRSRRSVIGKMVWGGAACVMASSFGAVEPVNALVKGVAPPPPKKAAGDRPKCVNVEECQEMAEKLAAEEDAKLRAIPPPLVTDKGTRYRDILPGSGRGRGVEDGDKVSIRYKVLKLGKRSYDGISGEGTVVFSRGYGLEDDETSAQTTSFEFQVGDPAIISALSDAIIGMKDGGTRRFSVLPQMGWEKPSKACDGGPGGSGSGGEIKTDYVIVPTASMLDQSSCFDTTKLPYPKTYAEQRRMAQRFDQSLLMEVELISVKV